MSCEERGARSEERIHSTFRLPPSAFRLRAAITLTEVLISMGILTLGLLGVAAIFPVGGYYMMNADIADRGSAIAQSAMSDLVTRGMLNPGAWFVMVPRSGPLPATSIFPADGKYSPKWDQKIDNVRCTFTRPFAETLTQALVQTNALPGTPAYDQTYINKQFGNAYVIDPMFVAAAIFPDKVNTQNLFAYAFPASANKIFPSGTGNYYKAAEWNPWRATNVQDMKWPVRRVTFQDQVGWSMNARMAEHYFRVSDDLATEFPKRDDRPAKQNWELVGADLNGDGVSNDPLARQWQGDYSWIATVVPTTNDARDGIARNPEGYAYDVSVVVFHKRIFPIGPAETPADTKPAQNERMVEGRIISTGLNGGEILLQALTDAIVGDPFEQLKSGQWVMLCGPHPTTNGMKLETLREPPRFVLNWYQVLSIDTEGTGIPGFDRVKQRVITVRGPEWPWQPAANLSDNTQLSNSLCVAICRGAVAVHTKTMRLEDPRTSPTTFGSIGERTATPPPYMLQ